MRFHQFIYIVIFSATAFLILSCSNNKKELVITNPADIERQDELIILKRPDLETTIGVIPAGKFVLILKDSIPVLVQYDDMDADGNWDELAFLYSFKGNEKLRLSFSIADAPAVIKAVVRAHVRHRKRNADNSFSPTLLKDTMPPINLFIDFSGIPLPRYQTDGPAWENDKIAFGLYFDGRNTKDIFGKLVPAMIMDTIGKDYQSYQELSDWGMNILYVGNSLGGGSVAIAAKATNGIDTLIRLGGRNIKNEIYEVLADGPIRAVFRIKYEWEINEHPVQIIDETSIWGGQYFYETKLDIKGTPKYAQAVAGFADFDNNIPGQINMSGSKIFYSYGLQSENKDNLGLAIAIDGKNYGWYSGITDSLSEIQNSYLVSQKFIAGEPVIYRFYSCWEQTDSKFKTEAGFQDFLKKEAVLLYSKLKMEWD